MSPLDKGEVDGIGFVNSFGVFETYYTTHQLASNTPSDIAWIGSFQVQNLGRVISDGRYFVCSQVACSLVGYSIPMVHDGYFYSVRVSL